MVSKVYVSPGVVCGDEKWSMGYRVFLARLVVNQSRSNGEGPMKRERESERERGGLI